MTLTRPSLCFARHLPSDELRGHAHPPLAVLHPDHADAEELVRGELVIDMDVLLPQLVMDCHDGPIVGVQTSSQHLRSGINIYIMHYDYA